MFSLEPWLFCKRQEEWMGGLGQCGIGERKELECFSGGTNIWRVVSEYYVMAGMEICQDIYGA